jgi:DnaJ domain
VYEAVSKQVQLVMSLTSFGPNNFNFSDLKVAVEQARSFGGFVADHLVILHEEIKPVLEEKWLAEISSLYREKFDEGRSYRFLKQCILIGVVPSAPERDIRRAYRIKAKDVHPDKKQRSGGDDDMEDANAAFRSVKEAHDILLDDAKERERSEAKPFDGVLRRPPLREKVRDFLTEQRYSCIKEVLFNLPSCPAGQSCFTAAELKENS